MIHVKTIQKYCGRQSKSGECPQNGDQLRNECGKMSELKKRAAHSEVATLSIASGKLRLNMLFDLLDKVRLRLRANQLIYHFAGFYEEDSGYGSNPVIER